MGTVHGVDTLRVAKRSDGRVVLRVTDTDGDRDVVMEAEAAQRVGTVIANAGIDAGGFDGKFMRIQSMHFLARRNADDIAVEIIFDSFGGPVVARIDTDVLMQLWQGAGDVLGVR